MGGGTVVTTLPDRRGGRCGFCLVVLAVRTIVPASAGRNQLGRVAEAMYALEPELAESDYAGAFGAGLARFRRRALIIVFTDLVEQAVGESLLPALPDRESVV